jgi:hypothetical protein
MHVGGELGGQVACGQVALSCILETGMVQDNTRHKLVGPLC